MNVDARQGERVAGAVDDTLHAAWAELRSFFSDGYAALERGLDTFRRIETEVRNSLDPSALTLWLLGISTALQYVRRPEAAEASLARARELVNLVGRTQGEGASIPYRVRVEESYRDLADVVPAESERSLAEGLEYSDRTLRVAKDSARDDWLAASLASRAELLLRTSRGDRRALKRALVLFDDAKARWPKRDAAGRAQLALRHAAALLTAGDAARAEMIVRDSLPQFVGDRDRYHEATGRWLLARALFALDQSEALDEQALAIEAFRALGTQWELRRAERVFE